MDFIRIGRISSTDTENKTARVIFEDKGKIVSAPLIILQNHLWFPDIGQMVLCIILPNSGGNDGFILGGF